ncbi:MAG: metal-dependent transcriptional regulator [Gemmatimonadales bacterium]|nr:metal-dependent transcriptional regulator [Gemmatimonadales bacterium]NIN12897.1 metal-dependent transcriptional regulator [Gemmatimonadales bacterium]NIR00184.1 metal-dependent transcriptional regulator [Gemmatimonadales bacterium]NIS65977.1 metal-dependent transcriptional regulator [Gemmatimonadales bacterium]
MNTGTKKPGYSRSTEDYLKAIYELESLGGSAQTSAIAEVLDIAPPSVSGMVKRLSESGLLEHVPYRGVQLTRAGRRTALKMVRRHRILETYLTSKLGYDWDSVHDEAERLEHAVSDELIERMAMALGNPRYDPHGAPIPTKDGEIEEPDLVPLADVPVGKTVELRMVSDKDSERLRFIASLGLRVGVVFETMARQPFRGPITIRLPGSKIQVVGNELAQLLYCVIRGQEVG